MLRRRIADVVLLVPGGIAVLVQGGASGNACGDPSVNAQTTNSLFDNAALPSILGC
jgi:hypothetical protein